MALDVQLPDGTLLAGTAPIVLIGPNGAGKTRQVRSITMPEGSPIVIVNALRNTRVTTEIPAMGLTSAKNNMISQNNQARSQYWDLVNDFDLLLARLHAEDAAAAIASRDEARSAGSWSEAPLSAMEQLQLIWKSVFPGRSLMWRENVPMVLSTIPGTTPEYQAQYMSDGEKAALYLAGKVLIAEPGLLVIDEPETHFHSLMAIDLWNALEAARADLRFVFVTHDLTFALSRRDAIYVLAHPTEPLRVLDPLDELPAEAAAMLLGAASFSFLAARLVLCEGDRSSRDFALFSAWFNGLDTVVRPMGSCQMVMRAVGVLRDTNIAVGIEPLGLIDRDFHPDAMIDALPPGIHALAVHEVESLYCLPGVVAAVARHQATTLDGNVYAQGLRQATNDARRHQVIIERWKRRVEGPLLDLVGQVASRTTDIDATLASVPSVFDQPSWSFSPADQLAEERAAVEARVPSGDLVTDLLVLMPGKSLISLAAEAVGLNTDGYCNLVNRALSGDAGLELLGAELEAALDPYLPPRLVRAQTEVEELVAAT